MNKKLFAFTAAVLVLIASAAAIQAPNETEYQNHPERRYMVPTNNNSTSPGSQVSSWQSHFTTTGQTQDFSQSTGVKNVTFYQDGNTYQVDFTGRVQAPTPCYTLNSSVEQVGDSSYTYTITVEPTNQGQMCAQVVTLIGYNASFQANHQFNLTVRHGNTVVKQLHTPRPESPTTPTQPNHQGWLSGLWNWIKHLF